MKAYGIRRYGGQREVEELDVPVPAVGPHDVLIRVRAASVNPVDLKIRSGALRQVLALELPLVLGNDCSGVVEAVGSSVRAFRPGDEVYTRVDKDRIGTLAELVAVTAANVAPKPAGLTHEQAASLPLVALTSWQALFGEGKLRCGTKVFIPAGSGGVGSLAIQLARHAGGHVATTTSTENVGWVKALGADEVIDYKRGRFGAKLAGYDLVFDTMGGETQRQAFTIMRPGGTLVSVVGPPTSEFAREFHLTRMVRFGSFLLSLGTKSRAWRRGVHYKFLFMRPSGEQLREITALVDAGAIRPIIDRVFPFRATKDALAYLESGRAKGKIVVSLADVAP